MRKVLLLASLAGATSVAAKPAEDVLSRVREAALRSDFAYSQLSALTDEIGPRLTGSVQAEATVALVAQQMLGA